MNTLEQPSRSSECDLRCHCGKLLARWEGQNLVIKCIRCRRLVRLSLAAIRGVPPLKRMSEPR
jgi:hypothetical protein